MTSERKPISRNPEPARTKAPASPPVLTAERRRAILERAKARREREERTAQYERLIRSHQQLSDGDFNSWLDACDAEGINATDQWQRLTRPLTERLTDLFAEPLKDWLRGNAPRDKILSPDLKDWGVLNNPKAESALAELVTYLEDARDETWRWRGMRTTWKVSEAERAEAIVKALKIVTAEGLDYVRNLTGDEPRPDPRIAAILQYLVAIHRLLRKASRERTPRVKVARTKIGPEPFWSRDIAKRLDEQLAALYKLRYSDFDSEESRAHVLATPVQADRPSPPSRRHAGL